MAVRLRVLADGGAVAAYAARQLLAACAEPLGPLGLATGRTMEPVYGAFVRHWHGLPSQQQRLWRRRWRSFNLDEYVGLAPADPRSFTAFMDRHLARPLGLQPRQLRLPDGLAADPDGEARRYGRELAAAGGIGLQLLGLGLNGHVGFNEPPCPADAPCRCVALSASTRRQNAGGFGGDPQAVPERAITLGLAEILQARRILLLVTGAAKAPILRRLLEDAPSPQLPASWLHGHPDCTLVADAAALGSGAAGAPGSASGDG